MNAITIRFACGHGFELEAGVTSAPVCPTCGEHRVSRTMAPAPRFTGWCAGPSADPKPLEGIPVAIPTKEP